MSGRVCHSSHFAALLIRESGRNWWREFGVDSLALESSDGDRQGFGPLSHVPLDPRNPFLTHTKRLRGVVEMDGVQNQF